MATQTITRYSRITLDLQPPVARISLQNSPLNIIDIPMMEELSQALAEIESHHDIPVVVLAGSGKALFAGGDVAAHKPDKIQTTVAKFYAILTALVNTKKVTIAPVHGAGFG